MRVHLGGSHTIVEDNIRPTRIRSESGAIRQAGARARIPEAVDVVAASGVVRTVFPRTGNLARPVE